MKIITSNIRFNNPADLENSWDARKEFYYTSMNSYKPLILATQEGRQDQLRQLELGLDGMLLEDRNRVWIDERMYPCLYLGQSIVVTDSGDRWLSETPTIAGSKLIDAAFPRLLTWAVLEFEGCQFIVVNMHLDHTTNEVRLAQATIAVAEIKKINSTQLPLVLTGDFNSAPDGVVYQYFIKELGLTDPWKLHEKSEESSYHKFLGSLPEGKRIDWILHSEEFKTKEIKLLKDHDQGVYLSDHFPVFCDISL
jgi:endonuclease/exonuclease/phosphatase family metal-dependent hydrolase